MNVLAPLLLGVAFGWALQRGGMTQYRKVADVFRFADLTLIKFLLTALAVGALGVQALRALGAAGEVPVSPTYLLGNALGGLCVGAGMALVGLCPGTVVAGAAEGRLDYAVPGLLGLLTGALAFGLAYPRFVPALSRVGYVGRVTAPELARVDAWLAVLLLGEIAALVLYALARWRPRGPAR